MKTSERLGEWINDLKLSGEFWEFVGQRLGRHVKRIGFPRARADELYIEFLKGHFRSAAFDAGPTGTHAAPGWYSVPLTAEHTNTLGSLVVKPSPEQKPTSVSEAIASFNEEELREAHKLAHTKARCSVCGSSEAHDCTKCKPLVSAEEAVEIKKLYVNGNIKPTHTLEARQRARREAQARREAEQPTDPWGAPIDTRGYPSTP